MNTSNTFTSAISSIEYAETDKITIGKIRPAIVNLIKKELGDQFDVVYPSASILAENPIAVVDKYADKHNTRAVAQAYAEFHFSETGQEIAAQHDLRPRLESVAAKHKGQFKDLTLFSVDDVFGGWANAQKAHFADGASFDQIYSK